MYKNLALEGINEDKSPMSNTDIILMDIAYLLKDIRDLKYKDLKNRSIIEWHPPKINPAKAGGFQTMTDNALLLGYILLEGKRNRNIYILKRLTYR